MAHSLAGALAMHTRSSFLLSLRPIGFIALIAWNLGCSSPSSVEGQPHTTGTEDNTPDSSASDAGTLEDANGSNDASEAPVRAPLPKVPNQGGPIIKNVHLVTITFANDPREREITEYGDWMVASDWLRDVGKEYGAENGTHTHVRLDTEAPSAVLTADTETRIRSLVAGGTVPHSEPSTDTVYMIHYPPGTTLTDLAPGLDCASNQDYMSGAWHDSFKDGSRDFAYAVVPACTRTTLDLLQVTMSHELIEAVTDPLPLTQPAYALDKTSSWFWMLGAEVADLCGSTPYVTNGIAATRVWSNEAAAKGEGPCVPHSNTPYFNVAPAKDEILHARAGTELTIDLTAWSTAPVADWHLSLFVNDPRVTAKLSRTRINSGQTVTVTAKLAANATTSAMSPIVIPVASQGKETTYWPITIRID